ncbi:hypothetical protein BGZ68_008134 [Mortierella alpina]|nr:hypothetical protein BGZ68_008134 [Mortierella alpina]
MSSSHSPSSRASSASLQPSENDPITSQPSLESAGAATSTGSSTTTTTTTTFSSTAAAAAIVAASTTETADATPPPEAAAFIHIKLHPRKGLPLTHCRAPKSFPGPFDLTLSMEYESFTEFCNKIRAQLVVSLPEFSWPRGAHPYIRPTHSATQTHYLELTEANFETRINKAWRTESRRLDGTAEEVYIHIFAYLIKAEQEKDGVRRPKTYSPATITATGYPINLENTNASSSRHPNMGGASGSGSGSGLGAGAKSAVTLTNGTSSTAHNNNNNSTSNNTLISSARFSRSTIAGTSVSAALQAKIDEAERRILTATQHHIIPPLGAVSTEMFARHLAMLPTMPSAESLELPNTLTFRHAMQLDEQARGLKRRMEAEESQGSDEYRTVRIKIQGVVMPVQIELRSLREALGLQTGLDAENDA